MATAIVGYESAPSAMQTFFSSDPVLEQHLNRALDQLWMDFPTLAPTQIAVTWVVYDPPYITNTGGALSALDFWQHRPGVPVIAAWS